MRFFAEMAGKFRIKLESCLSKFLSWVLMRFEHVSSTKKYYYPMIKKYFIECPWNNLKGFKDKPSYLPYTVQKRPCQATHAIVSEVFPIKKSLYILKWNWTKRRQLTVLLVNVYEYFSYKTKRKRLNKDCTKITEQKLLHNCHENKILL